MQRGFFFFFEEGRQSAEYCCEKQQMVPKAGDHGKAKARRGVPAG